LDIESIAIVKGEIKLIEIVGMNNKGNIDFKVPYFKLTDRSYDWFYIQLPLVYNILYNIKYLCIYIYNISI